jgi:hypothetical protein
MADATIITARKKERINAAHMAKGALRSSPITIILSESCCWPTIRSSKGGAKNDPAQMQEGMGETEELECTHRFHYNPV